MSFLSDHQEEDPESTTNTSNRTSRRSHFLVVAALVAAGIVAGVYALEHSGVDVRRALVDARTSSGDAATTAAVKTAFALSSRVSAFAIDVATNGGIVRLDGEVPSESIRELAVAIARDTAGVDDVEDLLKVEPAARPSPEIERLKKQIVDLEIRADLDGILLRNPELEGGDIRIAVEERDVTLEGKVDTAELKRRVAQIAQSVDNVRNVVNELQVPQSMEPATHESEPTGDAVLAKQVRFELYASGVFNLDLMEVRTIDGNVTLLGDVRSQAERMLAERIVHDIDGVQEVNNELDVIAIPSRASAITKDEATRSFLRMATQARL